MLAELGVSSWVLEIRTPCNSVNVHQGCNITKRLAARCSDKAVARFVFLPSRTADCIQMLQCQQGKFRKVQTTATTTAPLSPEPCSLWSCSHPWGRRRCRH